MPSDAFKNWLSRFDLDSAEFSSLTSDLQDLEERIASAEQDLLEQQAALEQLKADRDALRDLRNFFAHGRPPRSAGVQDAIRVDEHVSARVISPAGPSKREVVLNVLADGRSRSTAAIHKALVDAGEVGSDKKAYHALQVTLSQAYRAGDVDRVGRGVYKLASTNGSQQETLVEAPSLGPGGYEPEGA